MKVAIVHDYLTQRGGAERVVLSLHQLFPDAPIFTALYDPPSTFGEFAECDVRPSALQRLPHDFLSGRALLPLYPLTFGRMDLRGYELVISSSSGFAHGVKAADAAHLCYCYTPPRFLYRTDRYLESVGLHGRLLREGLRPVLAGLRRWDGRAARRPDAYLGVSAVTAQRVRALYGRACSVLYPPVHVAPAVPPGGDAPARLAHLRRAEYFLVVARLLPYKRIDLVIEACSAIGARLVVVGTGPMERDLRSLALASNAAQEAVEFLGTAEEAELGWLLANCAALVQAGEEDLGLVPLEANASGRPVVAYGAGGALETVVAGRTGVLFSDQTRESLARALADACHRHWDLETLQAHARQFSEERFHDGFLDAIEAVLAGRQPQPATGDEGAEIVEATG